MEKSFFFLAITLLYFTQVGTRPLLSGTTEYAAQAMPSNEDKSIYHECNNPESEECLIKTTMVDHTDYIYSQSITFP
ncbi:Phytosulfokine [Dillenia turbinata]|uniref:Phytosulfokine n=1 Tax=Dillenia turbinata TaxID=194707 RepID=A0AAN8VDE2_9MAGN